MIDIQPMRWWHIEQAMRWERELFGSTAWSAAQMWSELAREQRRYFVLVSDDESAADAGGSDPTGETTQSGEATVLGYAGINLLPPDADVQTVAVAPSIQGHGWARRLVDVLIAEARRADCAQVLLEVRADNTRAHRLYEGFGFDVIARRTSYYGPGEDALIMRLRPIPSLAVNPS